MIAKREIKKSLPHGYLTKVAKLAGVSKGAVSRYFNDSIKSSLRIEKAALECALEYQRSISPMAKELKAISK